jgi:hypothetical protein
MSATILASAPLVPAPAAPVVPRSTSTSDAVRWTARILTGLTMLFLTVDTVMKLVGVKAAVDGTVQLGYAPHHVPIIGVIELVCLVLYLVPRTAPLGAILWTGYFGGAIVTHLRLGNPLFTHILFPIYVAAILWWALYLRDARVRALVHGTR